MIYELNEKKIKIPDEEIKKNMQILKISQEDAIKMYLEDEGFLENIEQNELTKKAITSGVQKQMLKTGSNKKATNIKKEKKPDEQKEFLITQFANFLKNFTNNVTIENKSKLISFYYCEQKFTIDLKRNRK